MCDILLACTYNIKKINLVGIVSNYNVQLPVILIPKRAGKFAVNQLLNKTNRLYSSGFIYTYSGIVTFVFRVIRILC